MLKNPLSHINYPSLDNMSNSNSLQNKTLRPYSDKPKEILKHKMIMSLELERKKGVRQASPSGRQKQMGGLLNQKS